jgi:FtsP/CotA-like multicopper oxidase with cupredoxin domain
VAPGEEFVYRFRADQVGTYWYHTHSASHPGVRKGLYGTLVVHPRTPVDALDLTVPVHTFADGVTVFGDSDQPDERRVAPGTPVRLRLVNTDSDPRRFALAGARHRLAAVDGTDLADPGELERVGLRLAAGGRYDLTFAMPDRPVTLTAEGAVGLRLLPAAYPGEPETPDTAGWPELDLLHYGAPAPVPFQRFDRDFTLVLDRGLALVDGVPQYAQTVNGRAYPSIPTQLVREGELVRVTVVNRSLETHPWHLHGHRVLVLSRDGKPPTGSPLWLDTFDVRPGEVWQVGFRAANPGLWMNHCHNLPHAKAGMMLHLAYEGVSSGFHAEGRAG